MKRTLEKLLKEKNGEKVSMLYKMLPAAMADVPFHENMMVTTRDIAEHFPVQLAVHKVSPIIQAPSKYTHPHIHEDFDEINIILSGHKLTYKIQFGTNEYVADNNSCIWIPRGVTHAANILNGSGYFITLHIE